MLTPTQDSVKLLCITSLLNNIFLYRLCELASLFSILFSFFLFHARYYWKLNFATARQDDLYSDGMRIRDASACTQHIKKVIVSEILWRHTLSLLPVSISPASITPVLVLLETATAYKRCLNILAPNNHTLYIYIRNCAKVIHRPAKNSFINKKKSGSR